MSVKRDRTTLFSFLTVLSFLFIACASVAQPGPVMNLDVEAVMLRVADAEGEPLDPQSDPDTLVYTSEAFEHKPVTAPDGHQLTLAEFTAPKGRATVTCAEGGTRAELELRGLVPDGTYTLWSVFFGEPGFDGTMGNLLGGGAFGPFEEEQNAFVASRTGEANITVLQEGGETSFIPYEAAACLLNEFELHIVGDYHIDGETHGAVPGPKGSEAWQFAFVFKEGRPVTLADAGAQ